MLMPVLNSPDDVMHGRPPLATSHSDPNYPGFKFGISDENRSDWLALMHAHNTQHAAKVWEVPDDLNAVHKQAVPLESKASPALRSSTKKQNAAKAVTDTAAKPAAAAAADASAQKGKRASSTSSTSSNGVEDQDGFLGFPSVKLDFTDDFKAMVYEGIPHELRRQLWARCSGAPMNAATTRLRYHEIVVAAKNELNTPAVVGQIEKCECHCLLGCC